MILHVAHEWKIKPSIVQNDWSWKDIVLADAWLQYQNSFHNCGHPLSECMNNDANPRNRSGQKYKYVAEIHRCYACEAVTKKQEELQAKKNDINGVSVIAKRVPLASNQIE